MGQILYIDKKQGYTSFDVCHKLKKKFNTKRIGHTGTLDPNAEGVLIVMVDEACKVLPYIHHVFKTYRATMRLNVQTDTADIWGKVVKETSLPLPSFELVEQTLAMFMGKQMQIPPMTSAIKVNGKKLYELQRQGIEIERQARPIDVKMIKLISYDQEICFEAQVSTGTYIRSLIEDIAAAMGHIACMSSLVRISIDKITLEDCSTIEAVYEDNFRSYSIEEILSQYYTLVEYPKIDDVKNGKRIQLNHTEPIVMITHQGKIIAAYEKENENTYKSKRGLW